MKKKKRTLMFVIAGSCSVCKLNHLHLQERGLFRGTGKKKRETFFKEKREIKKEKKEEEKRKIGGKNSRGRLLL